MLFTVKVTVFSAANAADDVSALMATAEAITSLRMQILRSRVEKQRTEEIETDRGHDE